MSTGELLCRVAAAIRRHHVDVGVTQQLVDHLVVQLAMAMAMVMVMVMVMVIGDP